MLEAVLWIAGSVVSVGMYLFGVQVGRRQKVPLPPVMPELKCGCEHELAMHDPSTSRCHDDSEVRSKYNARGVHIGYETIACPCRQYTGPKPIDTVFQPRIALPGSET